MSASAEHSYVAIPIVRSAASLLHQAERAPTAVESALSQLVLTSTEMREGGLSSAPEAALVEALSARQV